MTFTPCNLVNSCLTGSAAPATRRSCTPPSGVWPGADPTGGPAGARLAGPPHPGDASAVAEHPVHLLDLGGLSRHDIVRELRGGLYSPLAFSALAISMAPSWCWTIISGHVLGNRLAPDVSQPDIVLISGSCSPFGGEDECGQAGGGAEGGTADDPAVRDHGRAPGIGSLKGMHAPGAAPHGRTASRGPL